jgi:hypothetical protein
MRIGGSADWWLDAAVAQWQWAVLLVLRKVL